MSITMSHTATFVAIILWFSSIVTAIRRLPTDRRLDGERILMSMDPNWSTGNNHTSSSHRRLSSNVDVPIPTQPDEHLVTNLPFLSADQFSTKHWAGLLPASNEGDKYFFYWLFAPEINDSNAVQEEQVPLVIWLNGGPGCSSMDGLFLENGPLRFEQKDGNGGYHLVAAEYSWHKSPAYVLYIDQPVGTGLSFTTSRKYPTNDLEVNRDFYIFLQSFFTVHGDKFVTNQRVNRNFYFSGESHSGHYIPSMMAYILDQNEKVASSNDSIYIPLSGAAIGNGWIDPFHQYAAAHAAYGHGIVDRAQRSALDGREKQCQSDLNNKRLTSAVCFSLLDEIVAQSYGSKSQFKVSQYDIRKVESNRGSREFPPGHKVVESYLGANNAMFDAGTTNQVLETIHAAPSRAAGQMYLECTDPPYDALSHQDGLGVVNEVVKVLHHEAEGEDPIRLLFFNGVMDLICNHVGNEVLLEQLPWQYQQEWIKAQRTAWKSKAQKDDSISGYIKEYKNLLFLKVMASGHMVPMDVPDVALDMMRVFLYGGQGAFQFSPQNLDRSADTNGQCPSCPTCATNFTNYGLDNRDSSEMRSSRKSLNGDGSKLWIGLGLCGVIVVAFFVYKRMSRPGSHMNLVPTYDLEMRGGTYFDEADDTGITKEDREV